LFGEVDWNSPDFTSSGWKGTIRRHAEELTKLMSAWPYLAVDVNGGVIQSVAGSLEPVPGTVRDFRLDVPANYPYVAPLAYAVGWDPQGPHHYGDRRLCLWRDNDWSKRHTLAYAVGKTFTWIHKHEVYLAYGTWPGKEQRH
jgi:hypothetical protein